MNSKFRNKLLQYEANPPERVWNELSEKLDTEKNHPFKQRLYNFEKIPPANIWSAISARLNRSKDSAVPFIKRYSRPLKYSGVAAALITFAILSSLLISKKSESELPTRKIVQHSGLPGINFPVKDENPGNDAESNNGRVTSKKKYTLRERISLQLRTRQANTMAFMNPPRLAKRNLAITFNQPVEKYMVYSDENGHAIRLPKKLFDAYACPDDNANCKMRLKKLQEKIASSSMTSDLTGILEMLNNLQENQ